MKTILHLFLLPDMKLPLKFLLICIGGFLCCICQLSIADESQSMKNTSEHSISIEKYYSNINMLTCGNHNITITSSCKDNNNEDEYCHTQTVAFIRKDGRLEKIFLYSYKSDPQPFIRSATCLKKRKSYYLSLDSSNLGSCKICEWSDYFSSNGIYLHSVKGMRDNTSFRVKIKQNNAFDGSSLIINSIELSIIKDRS